MNLLFKGVATALYTPFTQSGIDFEQFERLLERQLSAKVDALVFLGTTGEAPTVTLSERKRIVEFAVSRLKGKLPVIIGTGSNCTKTACELTTQAKELGADGALVVTPYYNRCEQDGLFLHYKEIAKVKLPFLAYSVPTRTGVEIAPETLKKIAELDCFYGIKEACVNKEKIKETFSVFSSEIPPVYCGSDEALKDFLKLNCAGIISVASNVIPLKIKEYISDFTNNYAERLKVEEGKLFTAFKALTTKVNPIPIKVLASLIYGENCTFRLPLNYPDDDYVEYLKRIINILN